ncbi:MAG: hypothetical protein KDC76_02395 [Bacteroidetes bacterium]|nr:hypothetical protein [Bacteroidota bacterium]
MKNVLTIYGLLFLMLGLMAGSSCQHDPLHPGTTPGGGNTDTTGNGGTDTTVFNDHHCDPDTVYFQNDIWPIIQSNCAYAGCHGDGSAEEGVDLTSYSKIIQTGKVRAFRPDNSELYEVITETDPDKVMPPPPKAGLTPEQKSLIATWINQGAKNNYCTDCDTTNVTFSGVISTIITNTCVGCHNAQSTQGGIRLDSYNAVKGEALSGALMGVVEHQSGFVGMPYNQTKLSPCTIDKLRKWVNDGAPNN